MLPEIQRNRVAWVFNEANFDIDLIIGVENIKIKDIDELKSLCMKKYDENFVNTVRAGDVIVGGENFGYGHPHPPAFRALRALGIFAAFCDSFSPGFYRAESSNGFPLIECPGISEKVDRWDEISFDWESETVTILKTNVVLHCNPIPLKTKGLIECGGMMGFIREKRLSQ